MVEMMTSRVVSKVMAVLIIVASMPSQHVVFTNATEHDVDWSPYTDLQAWADNTTFYPNDTLVFKYVPEYNVLEVSQLAFMNCLTTNPISEYNNGRTMIKLSEPGARFFISGELGDCSIRLSIDVYSH